MGSFDLLGFILDLSGNSFHYNDDFATGLSVEAVPVVDVGVEKDVNITTTTLGHDVIFDVIATNYGPDAATGVEITDPLPVGASYISDTPTSGTYNPATGVWFIGTMAPNTSETLSLQVQLDQVGLITNTATRTATNEGDENPANDQDSASVYVTSADVGSPFS